MACCALYPGSQKSTINLPSPSPPRAGFFYVRRKPPCCNSKHPKTCTPSLTPLSPGSRPDQSTDHQFPRRSSLLPALGRQRQAVSSPPQHLVSGLDRERTHPLVAKTFRFQRIPVPKLSLTGVRFDAPSLIDCSGHSLVQPRWPSLTQKAWGLVLRSNLPATPAPSAEPLWHLVVGEPMAQARSAIRPWAGMRKIRGRCTLCRHLPGANAHALGPL